MTIILYLALLAHSPFYDDGIDCLGLYDTCDDKEEDRTIEFERYFMPDVPLVEEPTNDEPIDDEPVYA